MAKYIVFEEGTLQTVNSLEAAKDQARGLASKASTIFIAEVLLKYKTEVSIKEVVAE